MVHAFCSTEQLRLTPNSVQQDQPLTFSCSLLHIAITSWTSSRPTLD